MSIRKKIGKTEKLERELQLDKIINRTYLIQNIGVFLIIAGYFKPFYSVTDLGVVLGLGAILFRHFKCGTPVFEIGRSSIPWPAIKAMLFFCILVLIASFFAVRPEISIKAAQVYLKYLRPFFLLLVLANHHVAFFQAIWFGMVVGAFGLCVAGDKSALEQFFVLNVGRPFGSLGHPNALAAHLLLLLTVMVAGILDKRFHKGLKFFAIISVLIVTFTLIITQSRGALAALVLASTGAIFYYARNRKRGLIVTMLLTATVFTLVSVYTPQTINKLVRIAQYEDTSRYAENGRIYVWQGSWNMFKEYPIFGVGYGNFNLVYNEKYMPKEATEFELPHAHNVILASLSETGIVGTIGFLNLLVYQLRFAYKHRFKRTGNIYPDMMFFAIITMLIHGMVDTMFHVDSYARYYWILWALTCLSVIYNKKNTPIN